MNIQGKRITASVSIALIIVLYVVSTIRFIPENERPGFNDRLIGYILAPAVWAVTYPTPPRMTTTTIYFAILGVSVAFYTVLAWMVIALWSWMRKRLSRKRAGGR